MLEQLGALDEQHHLIHLKAKDANPEVIIHDLSAAIADTENHIDRLRTNSDKTRMTILEVEQRVSQVQEEMTATNAHMLKAALEADWLRKTLREVAKLQAELEKGLRPLQNANLAADLEKR